MIGRLHRLAPWFLALGLVSMGLTIGASAAGSPPASGIVNSWAEWIVGNAIALVGGLIAWTQLTLRGVRQRIGDAIRSHNEDEETHHAAARRNHEPLFEQLREVRATLTKMDTKLGALVEGQASAVDELDEQARQLAEVQNGLLVLQSEHEILHGSALRRRTGDLPTIDPNELRGKR